VIQEQRAAPVWPDTRAWTALQENEARQEHQETSDDKDLRDQSVQQDHPAEMVTTGGWESEVTMASRARVVFEDPPEPEELPESRDHQEPPVSAEKPDLTDRWAVRDQPDLQESADRLDLSDFPALEAGKDREDRKASGAIAESKDSEARTRRTAPEELMGYQDNRAALVPQEPRVNPVVAARTV